jgi:cyclase
LLKKRVIPTLLYKEGRLVKGVNFKDYRETGLAHTALRVYSSQDADEILLIDISPEGSPPHEFENLIEIVADECIMPLTVGGGITDVNRISQLLRKGADKVLLNSSVFNNYELVRESVEKFGSQAIMVGVDFSLKGESYQIMSHRGTRAESISLTDHVIQIQENGAGEILLTSIDRDGTMQGYDLLVLEQLKNLIATPVVVSGGAGNFQDLSNALNHEMVSAAACASLFHFGDNNPIRARSFLKNQGVPMRSLK